MSTNLPPARSGETLPRPVEPERALDFPYRTKLAPEFEESGDNLRAQLLKYLNLALKHKLLVTVICAAFLFGGLIVTLMTTKIYSGYTSIKIDRAVPKVINDQQSQTEGQNNDPEFYQTQYELIKSRMLADRVATALNLAQSDFVGSPPPSILDRLFRRASPDNLARDVSAVRDRHEQAVDQIMGGLLVKPVGVSSIVLIRYSSPSPEWAQRISIAVAEQFEKMTLNMRFSASNYARNFLDERLQESKLKLETSEKQLIQYAQKEGIVDVDNKQPQVMTELQGIQNAYSSAVTTRITLEQTWQQAQTDGGMALPQVMSDGLIQAARGKLAQLRATYQDRLTVLKPGFPEMIALQSQINETERDIRNQINLIKNSIKAQYDAAAADQKALGDKLAQLKAEALDLRGRSVDYTILLREVDTNRSLYDGLLQQVRQLGVASNVDANNVSVLDRAQLPHTPDRPSLSMNLLLALVLGLATAAGAVSIIEIMDDTFKTPEDIEEKLGLAVLGITPLYRAPGEQKTALTEVMGDTTSPLSEAYRSLRTAIQFSTSEGAPRSLLVTSARPGEGKSTTAVCLALNFAQLGMRVLLIDADMRNPSVHHMLSLDNSRGLSNYLSGVSATEMIENSSVNGMFVMTTGPLPPNPAELLAGPRLRALLSTAAESFEIVIVDGPPVMGLADAPILASVADGTLLVIEGAKTRRAVVRDALKRLHFARARMVGGVLNKYHPKHGGASYGYGYGYGYNYGYGSGADKFVYGQTPKPALNSKQDAT